MPTRLVIVHRKSGILEKENAIENEKNRLLSRLRHRCHDHGVGPPSASPTKAPTATQHGDPTRPRRLSYRLADTIVLCGPRMLQPRSPNQPRVFKATLCIQPSAGALPLQIPTIPLPFSLDTRPRLFTVVARHAVVLDRRRSNPWREPSSSGIPGHPPSPSHCILHKICVAHRNSRVPEGLLSEPRQAMLSFNAHLPWACSLATRLQT